jgi:hypothetical protein
MTDDRVAFTDGGARVTMPPWPGEGEAYEVAGPWEPRLLS